MQKICHVIDSLHIGGAEKLLVGLINGLDGFFEQHLVVLHGPETLKDEIACPYSFTNLNCNSFSNLFLKVSDLKKYIKANKIDIVHSHLYEANLLARMATPKSVQLFNSIHAVSSRASYEVNRMTLHLEKLTYKKRHHLIAVSEEVLKDFDKWVGLKGKHTVLYNFIEDNFFVNLPKKNFSFNPFRLVAVGNLRYQKNYPFLIEAFRKMPRNVTLDIYGEGELRNELQQEIDKHSLNIKLCGISNELDKILPTYDAFIMSSFYEGQPVSLLEAMACGLPLILSDIPVLRETGGEQAIYFSIDNQNELHNRIENLVKGKYNLEHISIQNIERVREVASKSEYVKLLSHLYSNLT
jgi:glycosyltransferase involved in cell wall biosynthesis